MGPLGLLQVILGLTCRSVYSLSRAFVRINTKRRNPRQSLVDAHCRVNGNNMDFCASWREAGNCQNPRQIRRDVDEQPFHRVPLHPAFKVDVECQRRHSEQCRQGCGTQEVACATPRPAERQGDATHSPHAVGRWERRRAAESGGSHTQKFTGPLRWSNLSWLKEANPVQFQSSSSPSPSPDLRQPCTNRQRTRNGPSRFRFVSTSATSTTSTTLLPAPAPSQLLDQPPARDRLWHSLRSIRRDPRISIIYKLPRRTARSLLHDGCPRRTDDALQQRHDADEQVAEGALPHQRLPAASMPAAN